MTGANPITWKEIWADAHFAAGNYCDAVASYEHQRCFFSLNSRTYTIPYGVALLHVGEQAKAIAVFEEGLRLRPESPDIANNLGIIFHEKGEFERAADYYRQALRWQPDFPDASNSLAMILKEQGLLEEARAQYLETLRLRPDHAQAIYQLSELAAEGRHRFTSDELKRIKGYLASGRYSELDRSLFCFTLAAVLNKQGSFDDAFTYYQEANDLRYGILKENHKAFNSRKHQALVNHLIANENQPHFQKVRDWGVDSELPIFIIGMPRSGSTLVEQILASHPLVFGAGELGELPRMVTRLAKEAKSQYLLANKQMAQENAADFLRILTKLGKGAARVTTKTLDNYLHLGVIATLFPRARIIHCRRDPIDVCLSCYFQNFHEMAFSFSLEDIGAFYRLYEQIMAHWTQVLPMPIHEVCYEELVQNQEAVTRRLLAFCGLDWDERCLSFYKTNRPVVTASSVQVRKPMSAQSIGRWKNYRKHLGPLFQALGTTAPIHSYPPAIPYSMRLES